jgi:hypothetical protein
MLKGTLDDFTLPDIFRLLSQSKKTGRLDVERSAGRGNVFFKDGNVYFAESTLSRELVGQKLLKAKVLTDGQLMKALDEQAESGGRVGEVLRNAGLVTDVQLETALRGQIEDAVFDLLRWDAGEFDWAPDADVDAEVSLSVSVENLIMEGSRRLDEMAIITRKIPSEHAVVEMAPAPPEGAAEINIRPEEWRMLVLVNGQRTVLDIAEAVGSDVFATMRTLYGLAAAGLVHVPGHVIEDDGEPLPELPREPVAEAAPEMVVDEPQEQDEPEPPAAVEEEEASEDPDEAPSAEITETADAETSEDEGVEDEVVEPAGYHADAYAPDESLSFDAADLNGSAAEVPAAASEDSADESSPLEATDLPASDWFDAPEPGDVMVEEPAEASAGEVGGTDPFVDEILAPLDDSEEADPTPVAEIDSPNDAAPVAEVEGDPSENGDHHEQVVDKRDAVRELSDLFKQTEVDSRPTFIVPEDEKDDPEPEPDGPRHRVEDDEEITRGLISRLIDGVKGL